MKTTIQKKIIGLLLFPLLTYANARLTSRSFFSPRSQGVNAARELAGWQPYINQYCSDNYGSVTITPEYTRSFRPNQLAEYFFCCPTITFSGSRVTDRGNRDILADYFGLPFDFESSVCFTPHIENFLVDVDWYYGLDSWIEGMYVRLHVPFVNTRWDLNLTECIKNDGELRYIGGYMSADSINRVNLLSNAKEAFKGIKTFGDMREPLKFGKIDGKQTTTQLADIEIAWGWNYRKERGHAGLNFRFTVPLGTRPNGEFLFEPIVGNGHHYGIGFGLTSHYTFGLRENSYWGIYADANLTHLFKAEQMRSFDFKTNGPGSRYMLLQELVSPNVGALLISPDPASEEIEPRSGTSAQLQYNRTLVPAINKTTLKTKVRIGIQADIVIKLAYQGKRWGFDFGYNLWARSKEKLSRKEKFESGRWAIKGDVQVYGDDLTGLGLGSIIPLNATQSAATLHAGSGEGNANQQFLNMNADSIGAAQKLSLDPDDNPEILNLIQAIESNLIPGVEQGFVNGSQEPILLQDCDINTNGAAAPSAISNKLFVNLSYAKDPSACLVDVSWNPFVSIGSEVEIGQVNSKRASLSQWGIWLKTGVAF